MNTTQKLILTLVLMIASTAKADENMDAIRYMEGEWRMVATFYEDGKWGKPKTARVAWYSEE